MTKMVNIDKNDQDSLKEQNGQKLLKCPKWSKMTKMVKNR